MPDSDWTPENAPEMQRDFSEATNEEQPGLDEQPEEPQRNEPEMHLRPGGSLEQEVNTEVSNDENDKYQQWIENNLDEQSSDREIDLTTEFDRSAGE